MFVSVDLGNSRLMMMAAERQQDGLLNVLAIETAETPIDSIQNGIIKKPSEIASKILEMTRKMENRLEAKLNKKYVITGLTFAVNGRSLRSIRGSVQHAFASSVEIGASELLMLQNELQEKTNIDKEIYLITNEEYIIDGDYVRTPNNIVCREIVANYLIVAGRSDIRSNLDKCVNRVGLVDVDCSTLAPIAMADAVLSEEDKTEGVVHLNFGAATTTITVYQDGYLRHLAVVPFGGQHVTNDIRFINEDELKITPLEAEQLKVKYGEAVEVSAPKKLKLSSKPGAESRIVSSTDINKYIQARLAEIVMLCMKEVERSGYANQLRAGVDLSGGATRMIQFKEFVEQQIDMPVRVGSFVHNLAPESIEQYSDTEYTLLIGLLLNSTVDCVCEKSVEENRPIEPPVKQPGNKRKWFEKVVTLFDDPEESRIQD